MRPCFPINSPCVLAVAKENASKTITRMAVCHRGAISTGLGDSDALTAIGVVAIHPPAKVKSERAASTSYNERFQSAQESFYASLQRQRCRHHFGRAHCRR